MHSSVWRTCITATVWLAACGSDGGSAGGGGSGGGAAMGRAGSTVGLAASGGSSAGGRADMSRPLQYIRAEPYDRLAIEIDSVAGLAPFTTVESRIVNRLTGLLDKPGGIRVVPDQTLDAVGDAHTWTFEELQALADATFDPAPRDGEIRMHVMFVDGGYTSKAGGTVLGIAWDHMHVAVFQESIESGCQGSGLGLTDLLDDRLCADAQYSIWLHEIGHVLGLVDGGLAMVEPHADPDHPPHDASEDCVMYWAYEGTPLLDRLGGVLRGEAASVDFDAKCIADIDAAKRGP